MRLSKILDGIEYKVYPEGSDPEVSRITDDSRSAGPGDMFIAFRGFAENGREYIAQASARGAAVILSESDFDSPEGAVKVIVKDTRISLPAIAGNFYSHPSRSVRMIGVTGTNGKTTITYMIENILKASGRSAGVIGTINYRYGGREIPAGNTTPGPIELQAMLSGMAASGTDYCVMEVSSHALDQGRVAGIYFDAAIFTNLTAEHLDYHKTLEEYFRAKAKIFDRINKGGVSILNADDAMAASLKKSIKGKVVTYGLAGKSDISASSIKLSLDGSSFKVSTTAGSFDVSTTLVGRHNVSNALAAAAACISFGIGPDAIRKGLAALKCVPGRMEPVEAGQDYKVFVDFAHTEDALRKVLTLIREVSADKVITVFGCGGNRDAKKRPLMAKAACELSDHVVITSDNPRFEDPLGIIKDVTAGVEGINGNYTVCSDRRLAIEKALSLAAKGSIVVIAGKGHESYQIIGDRSLPFDDRSVAKQILSGRDGGNRI